MCGTKIFCSFCCNTTMNTRLEHHIHWRVNWERYMPAGGPGGISLLFLLGFLFQCQTYRTFGSAQMKRDFMQWGECMFCITVEAHNKRPRHRVISEQMVGEFLWVSGMGFPSILLTHELYSSASPSQHPPSLPPSSSPKSPSHTTTKMLQNKAMPQNHHNFLCSITMPM